MLGMLVRSHDLEAISMEKYIGRVVEIIYMGKHENITKRNIRVVSVEDGVVKAYCLKYRAPRIFKIDNILAFMPVRKQA